MSSEKNSPHNNESYEENKHQDTDFFQRKTLEGQLEDLERFYQKGRIIQSERNDEQGSS